MKVYNIKPKFILKIDQMLYLCCTRAFFRSYFKIKKPKISLRLLVRVKGLEPPHLAASDPKSDVSTNSTTPANWSANINQFSDLQMPTL